MEQNIICWCFISAAILKKTATKVGILFHRGRKGSFAIQFFSQKINLNYDLNDKKDCALDEFYCLFWPSYGGGSSKLEKKNLATDLLGRVVIRKYYNVA